LIGRSSRGEGAAHYGPQRDQRGNAKAARKLTFIKLKATKTSSIPLMFQGEVNVKRINSAQGTWATGLRFAWLLVMSAWLTACASSGATYPAAPTAAATPDYNYIIGPGDNLNIIVWRNPELSMSVPVRPDGKVSTPLVDELVAQGKTSLEVARDVEKTLSKFVRDPVVTVIVTGFVGPYSEQIRVVGEAAKPQALPYKQKMTLLDVMISVGGLTDFADGNAASITRASEGGARYSVRLKDLIKNGDISANVEMKPGDILIIPQGWF
jgi:polysaccharide biosynthesis/export protein